MNNIKLLAYYLPAFHEIEENNKWYGKGFTEWDNTKKAKPLFKGHNQPRIPEEYYDLSDIEVVKKQMKLAKENGVYGFVYYHYWFDKSGKKILEKPAEALRDLNKEEKIHYCFCWANESWRKTWHEGRGDSELLIEQKYEGEEDWEAHYLYLLSFFKDDMYIKVDNKPMLLIYKAENIPHYNEMVQFLNKKAVESGFSGIHIVRMLTNESVGAIECVCDAKVDFEPSYTLNCKMRHAFTNPWRFKTFAYWRLSKYNWYVKKHFNCIDYDRFYKTVERKPIRGKNYYFGVFSDWDNSPRKGKRATIINGSSPEKFKKHLEIIKNKAKINESEYIFCFAWNEWGEGGYLEPDKKYGQGYLSAIKEVLQN